MSITREILIWCDTCPPEVQFGHSDRYYTAKQAREGGFWHTVGKYDVCGDCWNGGRRIGVDGTIYETKGSNHERAR